MNSQTTQTMPPLPRQGFGIFARALSSWVKNRTKCSNIFHMPSCVRATLLTDTGTLRLSEYSFTLRSMVNPYFCYVLSFATALALYPLGWSDLYPPLSLSLIVFLLGTMVLHIVAGSAFARHRLASFRALPEPLLKS